MRDGQSTSRISEALIAGGGFRNRRCIPKASRIPCARFWWALASQTNRWAWINALYLLSVQLAQQRAALVLIPALSHFLLKKAH